MKNIISLLFVSLLCLSPAHFLAQKFEGKMTMKMEMLNLPPEMEAMKSMMEGNITTYIKGNLSRTEMNNPMTGSMFIITDLDKKEMVTCMDVMGTKTAMINSMEDPSTADNPQGFKKPEYKETGETKTIAGHNCVKSIYTMESNEGEKIMTEIWYAKDIPNSNSDYPELPGLPLEYSIAMEQMTMHFITTEVTKQSVDAEMFKIPADYKITTEAEMRKNPLGK